ncbi:polysaccharide deacetylase [Oceanobacillus chungangensis]|uniref:Polysaccharide deacetylase n=2 Tax=Oceanobacillus chungangensis TaxID=1229152 RepID=A0A3D8PS96_9BACI|nr:polysaccharide deacetylase [Oceanobacillus chungangensis]
MSMLILAACNTESASQPSMPSEEGKNESSNNDEGQSSEKDEVFEEKKPEVEEDELKEEEEEVNAAYKVSDDSSIVPLNDEINENVVLLTFDDAPDKYSLEIAETLKSMEANAIFFVNGHFINTPDGEEKLREIHDMGFMIGNHTYNHPLLSSISEEEQKEEIVSLNNRIEEIIGERPKFFRAPNGVNTDNSRQVVQDESMVLMNWTYGYDYFEPYMDKGKLTTAMVTGKGPEVDVPYSLLKPGANLLMHDREWTAAALKDIIDGLRKSGYEMVDPNLIQTN